MIRLVNIAIEDDLIKSDFFPEDSTDLGHIEVSVKGGCIVNAVLPKGYGWCKSHLDHAKDYLLKLWDSREEIPAEKLIMWY